MTRVDVIAHKDARSKNAAFTLAEVFSTHSAGYRKAAFILAEVLITLGIIGIVAALTMPTLIQNYQKQVTLERLKHFSSMIQQAVASRKADEILENVKTMDSITPQNPDSMLEYFNIYLKPYIKINNTEKTEKGILVHLDNGSAMYLQKDKACPSEANSLTCSTYIIFCPQAKHCEQLDESKSSAEAMADGKYSHVFWTSGTPDTQYKNLGKTRDWIIQRCSLVKTYCTSLIYYDGWQILDDNPCWK